MTSNQKLPDPPDSAKVIIENGNIDNLHDVMHVMQSAFPEAYGEGWNFHQCRSMMSMPTAKLLIARKHNQICGFVISRQAADEEELLMIAVAPADQNHGVGHLLLEHMLQAARARNVSAVFLEMRAENPAQHLYNRFGFQKIGIRKAYYTGPDQQKFDAITFKVSLTKTILG